ncbi:MAG: GTPase ObgE [Phycisphaerales bacterium]|nr:GTPase ObgE [Phycisphaerales bacterium]
MLVDSAVIFVRSGKGGHGCMSFRREKFVPKGGPDGGDGGKGGDVILEGDLHLNSLLKLTHLPHKRAANGMPGQGRQKHGADGEDLVVHVPLGTLVFNQDTEELIADISTPGQRVVVAHGGAGGYGNEHFKSATNQTPREFTEGEPWQEFTLRLELKLIADIGLVGMPNAGKSTLLSAITSARPKVADYPFTTLNPHLGIADLPGDRRLIIADIPGLIEGAAGGAGLGHDFLRHIERTSVLLHLLDVLPIDGSDPVSNYEVIRHELFAYSPALAEKRELIVLNKLDLISPDERDALVDRIAGQLGMEAGQRPVIISAVTGDGIGRLLESCWRLVHGEETPTGWGHSGAASQVE